ncbi:uncharacterized protein BXZ73DRAFT_79984 [Epithele typhae]|uniref:uncharacterized protein n=1 Tax=Epithele typhae TaxID=378194 RepID=UPI002008D44D|nr:uncharacterized protein BXZ73DRAFT_79984 [Epithele typhae]KAH9921211.1 hypothetical protein BXZ73DRAFT_79984 [Epithele typhae]
MPATTTQTAFPSSPSLASLASTSTAVSTTPLHGPKSKDYESAFGTLQSQYGLASPTPSPPTPRRSKSPSWLKRALGAPSRSSPARKSKPAPPPMTEEERRKDVARRAREAGFAKFTAKYGFSVVLHTGRVRVKSAYPYSTRGLPAPAWHGYGYSRVGGLGSRVWASSGLFMKHPRRGVIQ